jgi:DNA-binding LacI/PurR family transcriptional regulator
VPGRGSKTAGILNALRQAIAGGGYEVGDRIPPETRLAGQFGVSKNTVREAVTVLVEEGVLRRRQGSGTYVARADAAAALTVAVVLHTVGHIYAAQTRAVVTALQERGAIPVVLDAGECGIGDGIPDSGLLTTVLTRADGLVVEGTAEPFRALCASAGIDCPPAAVINHVGDPAAAVQVRADVAHGTWLGTRHLIALGHERILFVIHRDGNPGQNAGYEAILRGHRQALAEAGLEDRVRYLFLDDDFRVAADRERLAAILRAPDRPTAVFAYEDYRAKCVMETACAVGLSVPMDLALVGYFNTPWTEMTELPLTSVSMEEIAIARTAAADLLGLLSGEAVPSPRTIAPRLVVRASCGGVPSAPADEPVSAAAHGVPSVRS